MEEILRGSGYLPAKWGRERIAKAVIAEAEAGQGNVERLKEAGLAALREGNVVPLSLSFPFGRQQAQRPPAR
jgi:hypothetical protein